MASKTYAPIDLCGAQINRLDCDGFVLDGPTDVVLTCGTVEIGREPIAGEARSASDPNGSGGWCVRRTTPAKIEGYKLMVTLCSVTDADLMELLGIYDRVLDAHGVAIGSKPFASSSDCYCAPAVNGCANPGVSLISWSVAMCGEDQRTDLPFAVTAYPRVVFDPSTLSVTRNKDFNVYEIEGTTKPNLNWGRGPADIYPEVAGLSVPWAEFLTAVPYPGGCSCGVCDGTSGYVVPA